jgi:hypothetical protein
VSLSCLRSWNKMSMATVFRLQKLTRVLAAVAVALANGAGAELRVDGVAPSSRPWHGRPAQRAGLNRTRRWEREKAQCGMKKPVVKSWFKSVTSATAEVT